MIVATDLMADPLGPCDLTANEISEKAVIRCGWVREKIKAFGLGNLSFYRWEKKWFKMCLQTKVYTYHCDTIVIPPKTFETTPTILHP